LAKEPFLLLQFLLALYFGTGFASSNGTGKFFRCQLFPFVFVFPDPPAAENLKPLAL
jgi:hypothetical protein